MDKGGKDPTVRKGLKRKLTPFLCQEMLYEYATGRLDHERKSAVEEFLKTDKECQEILEGIRQAMRYTETLHAVEVSAEVLSHLKDAENVVSLGRKYSTWSEWPESLRWSVMAIAISSVVAFSVSLVPWSQMPGFRETVQSDYIEIAKIPQSASQLVADQEAGDDDSPVIDEGSGDEYIDDSVDVATAALVAAAQRPPEKPTENPAENPTERAQARTPERSPERSSEQSAQSVAATPQRVAPVSVAASPSTPEAESEAGDPASESERKEAKPQGFVYRAFMTLSDLEEIGPRITMNIEELKGEKAGEVELGWKRGSGRYYHFSMPAANEDKLLEQLRAYGPVRISKDPHPRVMPTGQVRFILWVESAN